MDGPSRGFVGQTWRVGDVAVRSVPEFSIWAADDLIPDATQPACAGYAGWLPSGAISSDGLQLAIQGFVIESRGRRILVDTCVGSGKSRRNPRLNCLDTPFLRNFHEIVGLPEVIDLVVCTHLHADHVGWNTTWVDGMWAPTFPNARYVLNDIETAYCRDATEGDAHEIFKDSIQPLFDHDLVDLVPAEHRLTDEVSLMSTPGHTIGHVSVWIESGGASALITGDAMHHSVQIARPEWGSKNDYDPDQAIASRRAIVDLCLSSNALLLGTHFVRPSGARLLSGPGGRVAEFGG
jgi:glyoxylase-like metal-dependent hydrolase (beta-lactamase superfamily II)